LIKVEIEVVIFDGCIWNRIGDDDLIVLRWPAAGEMPSSAPSSAWQAESE